MWPSGLKGRVHATLGGKAYPCHHRAKNFTYSMFYCSSSTIAAGISWGDSGDKNLGEHLRWVQFHISLYFFTIYLGFSQQPKPWSHLA